MPGAGRREGQPMFMFVAWNLLARSSCLRSTQRRPLRASPRVNISRDTMYCFLGGGAARGEHQMTKQYTLGLYCAVDTTRIV